MALLVDPFEYNCNHKYFLDVIVPVSNVDSPDSDIIPPAGVSSSQKSAVFVSVGSYPNTTRFALLDVFDPRFNSLIWSIAFDELCHL